MTENKITVLDFIISVLSQYEKEMDKQLDKLKRITERLEKSDSKGLDRRTTQISRSPSETRAIKRKISNK